MASEIASAPLFIVGMNGSGTTMLLDNLSRHPELYAFPRETRLIPHFQATVARFGDLSNDANYEALWNEVLSIPAFTEANGRTKVPLPDDWQSGGRDLASVLDGAFRIFAAREGKQRWCEKTPQHAQHLTMLAELFPTALFIHLVRDGRDCAVSFNRRWLRTPELTMFRWKNVVREASRQGRALGESRFLEIRYEDLTTDPERWLRRVCEFAGLRFHESILDSAQPYLKGSGKHPGKDAGKDADKGAGTEPVASSGLRPNSGRWKQYFTARCARRLERIGGAALHSFGYETAAPNGDWNPPKRLMRLWTVKDLFMQFGREIGLKLTGKIERPWRTILAKPFVAYRQRAANRY